MRHGTKRPQRDLALRMRLYDAVLVRRKAGESYNQIIKAVEEEFHVRLSKSHVSNWTRGDNVPDGSVTKFVPVPTAELGYVVGTMLGDDSTSITGDHCYKLKLRVTDKDFAQAFADAIAVVLNRTPPHVRYHAKTNGWHVDVSSLLLQQFVRKPIEELKTVIEQSEACSRGFLRGFFDSEGSSSDGRVSPVNTDQALIRLVLTQLHALGIQTSGPRLMSKGGRIVIIKGRMYHANKDCFIIRVQSDSRSVFLDKVGFKIQRKYEALSRALDIPRDK